METVNHRQTVDSGRAAPATLPPLTDSPWFWLLAFSGVALLGVVAVSPKYLRRQARAEQRFQNRIQTWQTQQSAMREEQRLQPGSGSTTFDGTRLADEYPPKAADWGATMESQAPRASLWPLVALIVLAMLIGSAGLIASRRASGRNAGHA